MIAEINLFGVYLPLLGVVMLIAFALTMLMKRALRRRGFYAHVWHPSLFNFAVFIILTGLFLFLWRGVS